MLCNPGSCQLCLLLVFAGLFCALATVSGRASSSVTRDVASGFDLGMESVHFLSIFCSAFTGFKSLFSSILTKDLTFSVEYKRN